MYQKLIKNTFIYHCWRRLFVDQATPPIIDSWFLKLLQKISIPRLADLCLISGLFFIWYEAWWQSINFGQVAQLAAYIFLGLAFLFCDKQRWHWSKAKLFSLGFLASLFLSALVNLQSGLTTALLLKGIALFSQFILAFWIAAASHNQIWLIKASLCLSLPLILLGLYQGLWGPSTSQLWVSEAETLIERRAYGLFSSPNVLASLIMINLLWSLRLFFSSTSKKKFLLLGYWVLSLVVLLLSYSRSAWLGLFAGLLVMGLFKFKQHLWVLLILAILIFFVPSVQQRVLTIFQNNYLVDSSLDGRIWSFNAAKELFRQAPIFGKGPGSYGGQLAIRYNSPVYRSGPQDAYVPLPYTDNQWLQLLVQLGLVGTLLLAGFFTSLISNNLIAYCKTKDFQAVIGVALSCAIIVNGGFANVLEFGAVAWLAGISLSFREK